MWKSQHKLRVADSAGPGVQESKMAAVYDNLLRDSVLLRKDLEYALVGCNDKQVRDLSHVPWACPVFNALTVPMCKFDC